MFKLIAAVARSAANSDTACILVPLVWSERNNLQIEVKRYCKDISSIYDMHLYKIMIKQQHIYTARGEKQVY